MYLEYPAGKPHLCMVPEVMHDLSDSDQCEFPACAMGRVNVNTIRWVIVWVSTDVKLSHMSKLFNYCITFDSEVGAFQWPYVNTNIMSGLLDMGEKVGDYTVKSTHRGIVLLLLMATIAAILTIISVVASKSTNPECGAWEGQQGIIYGLYMIFQLVLMFLTLYKHFEFYRMENSPIVATIYRDGVFYMLCITSCLQLYDKLLNRLLSYHILAISMEQGKPYHG
ncbi:hypothetical protein F4604DRAFT_1679160 [Suillus subluteus]|nr:hypothetical protein F4604DRAFT_1679160 [Suillus subluteus]